MQNSNVNQVVANSSNYTSAEALRGLAMKINKHICDLELDTERETLELEIDGYGMVVSYSAQMKEFRGGEPNEILRYPDNEKVAVTDMWILNDEDGADMPEARRFLNNLLN